MKSLCRRPPIAAQPRRDTGVTGWTRTSYSGVTARGLSTSPSATSLVPLVRFERTNFSFRGSCLKPDSAAAARKLVNRMGVDPITTA